MGLSKGDGQMKKSWDRGTACKNTNKNRKHNRAPEVQKVQWLGGEGGRVGVKRGLQLIGHSTLSGREFFQGSSKKEN